MWCASTVSALLNVRTYARGSNSNFTCDHKRLVQMLFALESNKERIFLHSPPAWGNKHFQTLIQKENDYVHQTHITVITENELQRTQRSRPATYTSVAYMLYRRQSINHLFSVVRGRGGEALPWPGLSGTRGLSRQVVGRTHYSRCILHWVSNGSAAGLKSCSAPLCLWLYLFQRLGGSSLSGGHDCERGRGRNYSRPSYPIPHSLLSNLSGNRAENPWKWPFVLIKWTGNGSATEGPFEKPIYLAQQLEQGAFVRN